MGAETPVDLVIEGRARDLGGFGVRRVLPSAKRRLVGPFIFLDQIGPAEFSPGEGIDVRPHPHINLATVTYLFDGEIFHRDSLGSAQAIRPGAVNLMVAGRGIVHSERTGGDVRAAGHRLFGIQSWIALPQADEEAEPAFYHHPADSLPVMERDGIKMRLIMGTAYGETSPVQTYSPMFYLEVDMAAGSELALPDEYAERAAYIVSGNVACGGTAYPPGRMVVFKPDGPASIKSEKAAKVLLLGGAPIDGERHIWWNFVSSRKERIEQAKRDWKEGRFPEVPGETEFIPLPEK